MSRRDIAPARRRAAPRAKQQARQSTRAQLLEVAGQVFSEKGFAGATGKEICERSGANSAAVVYHFGGMDNLYRAVLQEAICTVPSCKKRATGSPLRKLSRRPLRGRPTRRRS